MAQQVTRAQALTVDCPACQAKAGDSCTQPTDNGRKAVAWVHLARESAFQFPPEDAEQ